MAENTMYTGSLMDSLAGENLISGTYPPAHTRMVEMESAGIVARGTVLSVDSSTGKYSVMASGGEAAAIVAQATEATDTLVDVYVTGCFYRDLLTVAEGYELTAEDEFNLQKNGPILLTNGI